MQPSRPLGGCARRLAVRPLSRLAESTLALSFDGSRPRSLRLCATKTHASDKRNGSRRKMFDTEGFIREIEHHPAIWRQYSGDNRETKICEWQQVARAMYPEWDSWSPLRQNEAGRELQKKWKNIKDNFTKALKDQKAQRDSSGNVKKRRKYIYFDLLAFLLTTDVKKENNEEADETDDINCDALMEMPVETQLDENVQFLDPQMPIIHRETDDLPINLNRRRKRRIPYRPLEERLIKLLDKRQPTAADPLAPPEDILDEDKAFFASLLPSVRRLSDEQKMDFRLEILNCLKRLHYQKPEQQVTKEKESVGGRKRGSHSHRNQEPSSSNNHGRGDGEYS